MRPRASTIFLSCASLLVGAAVASGIWIVGGPGSARLRKFDDERLQSLQRLASEIDGHYAARQELPANLSALAAEAGDLAPAALQDPATGVAYGYQRRGPADYQLCARFSAASDAQTPIRWRHGRGQACYSFTAPQPKRTADGSR
ncbi:hypothetical protein LJR219_001545 [Phenylobacterium sp. LjRoot219]|uniref:hypothetical protein n=1 Tax=Phenylobacterium sp. LjRoot219 TaxID=3342283 RepID=UPI003ED07322